MVPPVWWACSQRMRRWCGAFANPPSAHSVPRKALAGLDGITDPSIWTDDPIHVPLLALQVAGPQWGPDYEADARSLGARVDYVVWEDISHFVMMERPEEFNALLEAFVEKLHAP